VIHDGRPMPCDPIQGQDHQGHGDPKVAEMADFSLSLPLVCM